jgi:outer membrane receptor protein involved in Fe transport
MQRSLTGIASAVALVAATAGPAAAQSSNWTFSGTFYLWASDTTLTTDTPRGEVESTLSFSDALKDLNFAFAGTVEARNEPWGIITDLQYLSLSSDGDTPAGLAFSKVEADTKMTVLSSYLAYRIVEDPTVAFDLGAGFRAFWSEIDTTLTGTAAPTESFSENDNFVIPVVAARLVLSFSENWTGTLFADLGTNGDQDTWQALATVGYRLNDNWSLLGGYRYMKTEWDTSNGQTSMELSGPVIGAVYRF